MNKGISYLWVSVFLSGFVLSGCVKKSDTVVTESVLDDYALQKYRNKKSVNPGPRSRSSITIKGGTVSVPSEISEDAETAVSDVHDPAAENTGTTADSNNSSADPVADIPPPEWYYPYQQRLPDVDAVQEGQLDYETQTPGSGDDF